MEPYWETNQKALNTQTGVFTSRYAKKIGENEMLAIERLQLSVISEMLEGATGRIEQRL